MQNQKLREEEQPLEPSEIKYLSNNTPAIGNVFSNSLQFTAFQSLPLRIMERFYALESSADVVSDNNYTVYFKDKDLYDYLLITCHNAYQWNAFARHTEKLFSILYAQLDFSDAKKVNRFNGTEQQLVKAFAKNNIIILAAEYGPKFTKLVYSALLTKNTLARDLVSIVVAYCGDNLLQFAPPPVNAAESKDKPTLDQKHNAPKKGIAQTNVTQVTATTFHHAAPSVETEQNNTDYQAIIEENSTKPSWCCCQ